MKHQLSLTYTLAQVGDDPAPVTPQSQNGQAVQSQPGGPQTGEGDQAQAQGQGGGDFGFLFLMVGLLVLMMVFMFTSQRRERKKRQSMLEALKKGDRVQSVGGIIGSVVDIRDDEIVVKVDENTNTRLRFARSAIQSVVSKEE